jgi:hypothetical protein
LVLNCTHLFCVNCTNDDRITKCPDCNAPKRVKCMVNLGGVLIVRKSEQRAMERRLASVEAPATSAPAPTEEEDTEAGTEDATRDAIYQLGYDPDDYLAAVREGRVPGNGNCIIETVF